jgi:uncharacterized membrane protein YagU involved in acid resistance
MNNAPRVSEEWIGLFVWIGWVVGGSVSALVRAGAAAGSHVRIVSM